MLGSILNILVLAGFETVILAAVEVLELKLLDLVPVLAPEAHVCLAEHLPPIQPQLLLAVGRPCTPTKNR